MPTLVEVAQSVGLDFGFAWTESDRQAYPALSDIVRTQSSIICDENQQLFATYALRPSESVYNFTNADSLLNWSATYGLRAVQGGHLIWDQELPSWVTSITNSTTLRSVMEDHIETVISYFGTRVSQWNVLNEAIKPSDGNPGNFRTGHWYNILGVDYAKWAFQAAAAVCPPGVELVYNCGNPGPWETAFVETLLDAGCRIDGVGFQMHVWNDWQLGYGGSSYHVEHMNNMASLGLDIYVTELDVRDSFYPLETRDADCVTAFNYAMDTVFRDVPRLKHVTCWSPSDTTSWVNFAYPRDDGQPTGGGNPYNRDTPPGENPMRQALIDAMLLRPPIIATGNVTNALTNDRATITVANATAALLARLGTDVILDHNGVALTGSGSLLDQSDALLTDQANASISDNGVDALTGQTTTGSESVTLTLTGGT